jgi:hypothetical protein
MLNRAAPTIQTFAFFILPNMSLSSFYLNFLLSGLVPLIIKDRAKSPLTFNHLKSFIISAQRTDKDPDRLRQFRRTEAGPTG